MFMVYNFTQKVLNTFPVIYKNTKELDYYRNRFLENIKKLNQIIVKNKNQTKNKVIMGIMHKKYNVHGVQFHPESIKTRLGINILKNFLKYKVE